MKKIMLILALVAIAVFALASTVSACATWSHFCFQ